MRDPSPTPDPDSASVPSRFSGFHARTYEMELLVSGALVFGLFQLPSVVGVAMERYSAGLAGDLRLVGALAQTYVMLALYVLIGTFLLHLALRAHWIGLLGLESVFQRGIRWDRLKVGPLTIAAYRARLDSLARAIDRADDLCSLIFSFGFLIVIMFVYTIAVLLAASLVALSVSHLVLEDGRVIEVFWTVLGVFIGVQMLAGSLDKRYGSRVARGGVCARLLGMLVDAAFVISPMRWGGPIQLTLQTNLAPGRLGAAIIAVSTLFGVATIGAKLADRGLLRFDNRSYFPSSLREEGMDPRHYRDRRDRGAVEPKVPSVQSRLVNGPYLDLVIPYFPRRHNALIESSCPDLPPLRSDRPLFGSGDEDNSASIRAAATCVGSLFEVRLDGQALADQHWDFTVEPGSRLPAVASFLPVRGLDPGRHELEVLVPGRDASADDPDAERHIIPFWR